MSYPRQPSRWAKGQPLEARRLNQLIDAVTDREGALARKPARREGSALEEMEILSLHDNHVVARPTWGTGASGVEVALPYDFRRSSYDELTIAGVDYDFTSFGEREATDGTTTETQLITPDYRVGSVILCLFHPTSPTLINISTTNSSDPADLVPMLWLDVNASGRAWAVDT
jgi:hypothetical protein